MNLYPRRWVRYGVIGGLPSQHQPVGCIPRAAIFLAVGVPLLAKELNG